MVLTNNIKPCRVCGKTNVVYPPSRIKKKDWICTDCSNKQRNEWWSKYRAKKREMENPQKTGSEIATLEAQLEFLQVMEDKPTCPFCKRKMTPTRGYTDRGKKLGWECIRCNDLIIGKGL